MRKKLDFFGSNKFIYKFILVMVALVFFFSALPVSATEKEQILVNPKTSVTKVTKYPPYPDVWDWAAPKKDFPIENMAVKVMDNGDLMITYRQDRKNGKFKTVSFFGRNSISDYEAVYKGDYTDDAKSYIPFKGDYVLRKVGGGTRSGGCYDALGFNITIMDKTQIKTLSSKKLLYVYDKPRFYETHSPRCMDGPSFYYRVEAVPAKFFNLTDGTFLLVALEGYVIRFDENFQTKSKLINDKFFWMEDTEWREFEAKYGDRSVGDKDLKRLYNDLYKMLTKKRR